MEIFPGFFPRIFSRIFYPVFSPDIGIGVAQSKRNDNPVTLKVRGLKKNPYREAISMSPNHAWVAVKTRVKSGEATSDECFDTHPQVMRAY
jgi:hypothetical protein